MMNVHHLFHRRHQYHELPHTCATTQHGHLYRSKPNNGKEEDDEEDRQRNLVLKLQSQIEQTMNDLNEEEATEEENDDDDDEEEDDDEGNNEINLKAENIESTIMELESIFTTQNILHNENDENDEEDYHDLSTTSTSSSLQERFAPTIGLYNVSYVLSKRKGENPVGGKWTRKTTKRRKSTKRTTTTNNYSQSTTRSRKRKFQFDLINVLAQKLISTRRTMQHIIPVNSTSIGQVYFNVTNYNEINNNKKKQKQEDETYVTTTTTTASAVDVRPVVAEAINVITLDALWNLIRISIILRGDAVPLTKQERTPSSHSSSSSPLSLSNLAIKAYFDSPRIIFGTTKTIGSGSNQGSKFLNLSIGPKSSVILDTTYVDDKIRIGMGGTSGTRFVFQKLCDWKMHENDYGNNDHFVDDNVDEEALEFTKFLVMKPTGKSKILTVLSVFGVFGGLLARNWNGVGASAATTANTATSILFSRLLKVLGKMISFTSLLLFVGTLFSTGGIEEDELRRGKRSTSTK